MDNQIILGDAYDLIKKVPDKSVDLVIMDPPYEIDMHQKSASGCFGKFKKSQRVELMNISSGFNFSIFDELVRVLKKINMYVFCSCKQMLKIIDFFKKYEFVYIDVLIWHKVNAIPATAASYMQDIEYCLFIKEPGVPIYGNGLTKKKVFSSPTNKDDKRAFSHPTVKPYKMISNFIMNSSLAGGGSIRSICWIWHDRGRGPRPRPEIYRF